MGNAFTPPSTVFHGTDSHFEQFDLETSLGAHFGTRQAALDRLKSTGRHRIEYQTYPENGGWMVREQTWSNRPCFEHGPFEDEAAADCFILTAPKHRQPLEFEIDVYRPLVLEDLGVWTFEAVFAKLAREHGDMFGLAADQVWDAWNRSSKSGWDALKATLAQAGYDCIAYTNETEDPGSISWIVMDPGKIHPKWKPSAEQDAVFERPRMRA